MCPLLELVVGGLLIESLKVVVEDYWPETIIEGGAKSWFINFFSTLETNTHKVEE